MHWWGRRTGLKGNMAKLSVGFIEEKLFRFFPNHFGLTIGYELRPTGFFLWNELTNAKTTHSVSFPLLEFYFLQIWALITLSKVQEGNLD